MSDHLQTIPDQKNILIHFDQNDPVMAQVIRRIGPLKLKRNRNYFCCVVQGYCRATDFSSRGRYDYWSLSGTI